MLDGRRSYRKTTVVAAAVTLGGLSLLFILGRVGVAGAGGRSLLAWGCWVGATLAVGVASAWTCLVAAGGLIALRRDELEEEGRPYASKARRESVAGPFRMWLYRTLRWSERAGARPPARLALRPGEWVEIRSLEEILRTLRSDGTLDGVPFMPEMAAYCGQRARVFRRVDKLNDWIHSAGLKRLHNLVLLEDIRCDGSAHGGCQANCHLRWRESWLRRSKPGPAPHAAGDSPAANAAGAVLSASCVRDDGTGETRFVCQATELTTGAAPVAWGDPRHYARDVVYGNVRPGLFLLGVAIACFNWVQRKRDGARFPAYACGASKSSPHETLNLQPGERVRVKPKHSIEPTLNAASRNRGLYFDKDMLRYCGGEYTVKARLQRVISEKTGKLIQLTVPCIILEGVTATGEYLGFNPEDEHIFWREIWLERAPVGGPAAGPKAAGSTTGAGSDEAGP